MGAQPRRHGPPIRPRSPEIKPEGSSLGAQPLCRGPPIQPKRPERKHKGSPTMKGVQWQPTPFLRSPAEWEPSPVATAHPSDPGAQKLNLKGAHWEPSLFAVARPSNPRGVQWQPTPFLRSPAEWEPSPVATAHPSDPGAQKLNLKGAHWEPSLFAVAHASNPTGNMKGAQWSPPRCRGPPIQPEPRTET